MARWRTLSQLSVVLGLELACLSCGGTGSEADRKAAIPAPKRFEFADPDPGSLLNYDCNADKPIEGITLHMIEDWEAGSGAGWYTNNDKCEICQEATDKINGTIDTGALADAGALEEGLASRSACVQDCYLSQLPSYFAKPIPATAIPPTETNPDGGRCGSKYAFRVLSGPFSSWGGQLGMNLKPPQCVEATCSCNEWTDVDCSAYTDSVQVSGGPYDGIAFWARVAPGSGQSMRIQIGESHTDYKYPYTTNGNPPCEEKVSQKSPDNTRIGCDAFGLFVTLNKDWQFFTLPFVEMRQAGWGKHAPFFDTQHISNLTFFYGPGVWDIWIDDIAYYKRSAQ